MSTNTSIHTGRTIPQKLIGAFIEAARALFRFGGLWFVLGNFITFIPGAEKEWFMVAAGFVAFGLFVPRWHYRIPAAIFLLLSVLAAFDSHHRGIEYGQRLEQSRATTPSLPQP
jgi:hypothetical protein